MAFWIQNIRAENYCLNAVVHNPAHKAWTYTGWVVSPWTLRAYCTWPGMAGLSPAMSEYAGGAAAPTVVDMVTMQDIERAFDRLGVREGHPRGGS